MKTRSTFVVSAPPEKVGEAFCSEAYNLAEGQGRDDVASVQYKLIRESEDEVLYEVHYVEYKRSKLGKIDRSGTTNAHTENRYDPREMTLSWIYRSASGKHRFHLSGIYRFQLQGTKTQVVCEADIDVRMPLIGNQIAKLIAKEFKKDMPRIQRLLEQHSG